MGMDEEGRQLAPPRTRVDGVMASLRERISTRALLPGARVPSLRAMAEGLGVSKSTVVEAYDRLASEGVLEARRGSGFFVAGHAPPLALADLGPRLDRAVDPVWLSRQALETDEAAALKPGCGWLPSSWLPEDSMRRALRGIARDAAAPLARYAEPAGLPALRQQLAWRMAQHGIQADPAQIVLVDGCTHALDLVCRFLLEPGDTVLLDDPCYYNFQGMLRAHRAQVVSVPRTPEGPDLAALERVLAEHRPRLYIANAALHNPTGTALTPAMVHQVLKLAAQYELLIVEDDIFADFETDSAPRLAAYDGLSRVISIGSFSKTLSASMRCGFIAARRDWIEGLIDLKIATSFGAGRLAAELVLHVLVDGSYRKHIDGLRMRLAQARSEAAARLKSIGIQPWIEPQAGMFLWCRLPDGLDAAEVARAALAQNVVLAPGNVFSLSQSATDFMRFNVSQTRDDRIFDVLRAALHEARPG